MISSPHDDTSHDVSLLDSCMDLDDVTCSWTSSATLDGVQRGMPRELAWEYVSRESGDRIGQIELLREMVQAWFGRDVCAHGTHHLCAARDCAQTLQQAAAASAHSVTGHLSRGVGRHVHHIGTMASMAGAAGVVAGVCEQAWHHLDHLRHGSITTSEYVARMAHGGISSGVSTAGRTAAALTLKEGTKVIARRIGSETLKRFASSNAATAVAFGAVEQAVHTVHFAQDKIDKKEYLTRSTQTAGATGGALGGAAAGAALGSFVPGLGTLIGAMVGGVAGAVGGGAGGRKLGARLFGSTDPSDVDQTD